jgi:hypothetical protein
MKRPAPDCPADALQRLRAGCREKAVRKDALAAFRPRRFRRISFIRAIAMNRYRQGDFETQYYPKWDRQESIVLLHSACFARNDARQPP